MDSGTILQDVLGIGWRFGISHPADQSANLARWRWTHCLFLHLEGKPREQFIRCDRSENICEQTSVVIESMKWLSWQRLRLSKPMNQSGEGTNFVNMDTCKDELQISPNLQNMNHLCIVTINKDCSRCVSTPWSNWGSNESIKKIVSSSFSVKFITVTSFYKLLDTLPCYRTNAKQAESFIVRKTLEKGWYNFLNQSLFLPIVLDHCAGGLHSGYCLGNCFSSQNVLILSL